MKIRTGFVSNSSSSSFLVFYKNGWSKDKLQQYKDKVYFDDYSSDREGKNFFRLTEEVVDYIINKWDDITNWRRGDVKLKGSLDIVFDMVPIEEGKPLEYLKIAVDKLSKEEPDVSIREMDISYHCEECGSLKSFKEQYIEER